MSTLDGTGNCHPAADGCHLVLFCFIATSGGGDYGPLSTHITFPNGSADGAEICEVATVYTDKLVEFEERFVVVLDLVTSGANFDIGNNISSITLFDDDGILISLQWLNSIILIPFFLQLQCLEYLLQQLWLGAH
jgi:hypothetical protein